MLKNRLTLLGASFVLAAAVAAVANAPSTQAATSSVKPAGSTHDAIWITATATNHFSCGITTTNTLWCFGQNDLGQLGLGDQDPSRDPLQVGTLATWTTLASNNDHSCATQMDNTLWCWGNNVNGQLGDGTTTMRVSPVQVAGSSWASVSAGASHVCATKLDGTLWCWGGNGSGQLGTGDTTEQHAPVQVGALTTWSTVAAGGNHTCATRTDQTLWCWGSNANGELGTGRNPFETSPRRVGPAATSVGGGWLAGELRRPAHLWYPQASGLCGAGGTTGSILRSAGQPRSVPRTPGRR